jgi:hypothetical protein
MRLLLGFIPPKHVESLSCKTKLGSLGIELEESGRTTLNGRVFSLQKEQLGIIPSTPIKLTHDNWGGK